MKKVFEIRDDEMHDLLMKCLRPHYKTSLRMAYLKWLFDIKVDPK